MAANSHALLSASSAHRWLNCTPSARLTEAMDDITSEFAKEGTDAHALCEYKLNSLLGIEEEYPELEYYSNEMEECANGYVAYISEVYEELNQANTHPVVLVETRLDFSKYVPDGFGTGDALIASEGTLNIIDYKHGKGVEVSAIDNPQMKLYALGALELFDCLYDINKIVMTIYQPRLSNISTYEITKDDLLKWANDELIPKAQMAFKGEGNLSCGAWCKFCKLKSTCQERARVNLELAKYEFLEASLLKDTDIADILKKADDFTSWISDVKEYALSEALKGVKYPGFKVVEGKANRKYTDEEAVANEVKKLGVDPYDHKLKSITEMTKLLGKEKFKVLDGYITKPHGKPTLVPDTDKRPEYNSAALDFENIEIGDN